MSAEEPIMDTMNVEDVSVEDKVSVDDADELALLEKIKNKNSSKIRSCSKCNRYLKRSWRGDICSRCQYKKKYHNKVITNIKKSFMEHENPFVESNNVDFNDKSDSYIKTLYKLLDMYFNPADDREKLITRLNYYKTMINQ